MGRADGHSPPKAQVREDEGNEFQKLPPATNQGVKGCSSCVLQEPGSFQPSQLGPAYKGQWELASPLPPPPELGGLIVDYLSPFLRCPAGASLRNSETPKLQKLHIEGGEDESLQAAGPRGIVLKESPLPHREGG